MLHAPRFLAALHCLFFSLALGANSAERRIIRFPTDRNCGTILLYKHLPPVDGMSRYGGRPKRKGNAQGTVILNDRSLIRLHISAEQSYDLSFLDNLPIDVIDDLHIVGAKIGKKEFASIARLNVEYLLLAECIVEESLAAANFRTNHELRVLNTHKCRNELALIQWALRGKNFQHIHLHLNLETLTALNGSRRVLTAQIDLDNDFAEMLDALNLRFPNLRGLHVYEVDAKSGRTNVQSIRQFTNLRWLDWHNAVLTPEFLKVLAELPTLEKLNIDDPLEISPGNQMLQGSLAHVKELKITGARFLENTQEDDLEKLTLLLQSQP